MDMKERAQELTIAISKRATSGGTFDFQAAYALILDTLEGLAQAQRERDAGVAGDVAREYAATQAVDETTRDYLTGAESCARRIAALILAQS